MLAKHDSIEVKESPGKGRGIFCIKTIKEGQKIFTESPTVIGPKQTSPFVCVDCFDYIDEQSVSPCRKCGLPLCPDCLKISKPKYHNQECKIFEESGKYKQDPITTYKNAKAIYMFLTPLRLLLKSETCPELLQLDGKTEERADTLIYFLTLSHVIKPIHKTLGLADRFSAEQIQIACGILDTNCYEIKWDRGIARGLFSQVALINHDCAPNCRKFFDAHRNMHVMTSCDVDHQDELSVSYTSPLYSTPMRQAILQQTKHFQCICQRCQDPQELGSGLSLLKCKNKAEQCTGMAALVDPLSAESDWTCKSCQFTISCDMAKMMLETSMNSINGQNTGDAQDTLDTLTNLGRFLPESNHVMVDLKLKLIDQVIENDDFRNQFEDKATEFCFQLLQTARVIAPGKSKLRGILSMKYHQLTEKGPNPLVLPKDYIDNMFAEDQSVLLLD